MINKGNANYHFVHTEVIIMSDIMPTEPTGSVEFDLDRSIEDLIAKTMSGNDKADLTPADQERFLTLLTQRSMLMMPDTRSISALRAKSSAGIATE